MSLEESMRAARVSRLKEFWAYAVYVQAYLQCTNDRVGPINGYLIQEPDMDNKTYDFRLDMIEDVFDGACSIMERLLAKNLVARKSPRQCGNPEQGNSGPDGGRSPFVR